MTQLHSYPSIYSLGHAAIQDLFLDPVVVEEKVDGSQFSFGVAMTGDTEGPDYGQKLLIRSKGAVINPQAPPKLFARAVATVLDLWTRGLLAAGVVYRGEVLDTPHHNTLTYSRVPVGHVVLFDIDTPAQTFLSPEMKETEAVRLGLEVVPHLYTGMVGNIEELKALLGRESFLGGPKVEGIVVKNYSRFGRDKEGVAGEVGPRRVQGGEPCHAPDRAVDAGPDRNEAQDRGALAQGHPASARERPTPARAPGHRAAAEGDRG